MATELTARQQLVLAAFATSRGDSLAPVQVQKLFFLIDENIATDVGGKQFAFEPYDYGPFDRSVYMELERLENMGLVAVVRPNSDGPRRYSLSQNGQEIGEKAFGKLPGRAQKYIQDVSSWIRKLTFAQLVGSIYKAYPQMRSNSIFQE